MSLRNDTRAASIPITHAMTIAITALLMASLLVGAGTFLGNQQETAARAQLGEVAGDVADQINTLDRLNGTGEIATASFEPDYERTAGGAPYTISLVTPSGSGPHHEATLFVNSTAMDYPVRLPLESDTELRQERIRGENPTLSLCAIGSDQFITLGECV